MFQENISFNPHLALYDKNYLRNMSRPLDIEILHESFYNNFIEDGINSNFIRCSNQTQRMYELISKSSGFPQFAGKMFESFIVNILSRNKNTLKKVISNCSDYKDQICFSNNNSISFDSHIDRILERVIPYGTGLQYTKENYGREFFNCSDNNDIKFLIRKPNSQYINNLSKDLETDYSSNRDLSIQLKAIRNIDEKVINSIKPLGNNNEQYDNILTLLKHKDGKHNYFYLLEEYYFRNPDTQLIPYNLFCPEMFDINQNLIDSYYFYMNIMYESNYINSYIQKFSYLY